jgi:hypothetical protein
MNEAQNVQINDSKTMHLNLKKSFRYEIDEPVTLTRTNGDQTVTLPDDSLNTINSKDEPLVPATVSPLKTHGFSF